MYHVYIKQDSDFDPKKLIGNFKDLDAAEERINKELAKNEDIKYILEETTGHVDNYGELISTVIKEN